MAKLTLAFKDRKLKIFVIPPEQCLIGRDPECLIHIDSLAVEPMHARISTRGESIFVEPCDERTSVLVNNDEISTALELQEGDQIRIGKHSLSFSAEKGGTVLDPATATRPQTGWLQILTGSHLGRTIRLDKAFTRIGKSDVQLAIIARRDDGYYVTHLQGDSVPSVNNQEIGDAAHKLNNGDEITLGELQVQFFTEDNATQDTDTSVSEQQANPQRQFSRIPFDVPATLRLGEQQWETCLIDISLHGALVKVPDEFECSANAEFQLAVHLEGGPDINMDVEAAHHENGQLGLRCHDIDVDSITCLRRLVELNLGDPDLLERELSALG